MKRLISILLVLTAIVTPIIAISENNDDFITVEETFENLDAGDVVEVEFEYADLTEENMELDGFKLLGYENGKYQFEAERDMDTGYIKLQYKVVKEEVEEEHESGETNEVDEVGTGEGTIINWGDFKLGKNGWNLGQAVHYAIRIDAKEYQNYKEIYVIDESTGLDEAQEITVSKLEPDANGVVINTGLANYEVLKNEKGTLIVKIEIDKLENDEELRYDFNYKMNKLDKEFSNSYKVVSKSEYEKIIAKGEGTGNTTEEPEEPIEEPENKPEPKPEPQPEPEEKPEEPATEEEKPEKEPEKETEEEPKPIPEEDEEKDKKEEKEDKKEKEKPRRKKRRKKEDKDPVEKPKEEEPKEEDELIIIEEKEDENIEVADAEPIEEDEIEETDEEEIIEDEEVIEEQEEQEVVEEKTEVKGVETKPELYTDETLPKTGESKLKLEYIVGLTLVVAGLIVRRKL